MGVSGFIGSHLAEKLLEKGVQVIGVDNLSSGSKGNLIECVKNRNFHFLNEDIADSQTIKKLLNLVLPRIDYAFFTAESGKNSSAYVSGLVNFMHFLKDVRDRNIKDGEMVQTEDKPRILLCSSIDLYDSDGSRDKRFLKEAEIKFAKFIKFYQMNGRVVRLAAVYGPRMHFREKDPMIRMLQISLKGDLQKEQVDNDFSTRAIFIEDAVDLIIKAIFAGGTSQKIFDGSLLQPVKISEIKQILLDPVWHEEKNFKPTELPPWPTPNLQKTMSDLGWRPKTAIVAALKETVVYLKRHSDDVPETYASKYQDEAKKWSFSNTSIYEEMDSGKDKKVSRSVNPEEQEQIKIKHARGERLKQGLGVIILTSILIIGLFYPLAKFVVGGVMMRNNLVNAQVAIQDGNFNKAKSEIGQIQTTLKGTTDILDSLIVVKRIGLFGENIKTLEDVIDTLEEGVEGINHAIVGSEALFQTTKIISGEDSSDPAPLYATAQIELVSASEKLSKVNAKLKEEGFLNQFPSVIREQLVDLQSKISLYQDLVDQARVAAVLLPEITAIDGKKSYLVLLQNNLELRPGGGFIGSYGKFDFVDGRLAGIKVDDIYNLDGQLQDIIEPPAEIKTHLNVDRWYLRDSNYDPDFPTSAKQAAFFYKKESGELINGVIALDLTASSKLLDAVGGLDLPEYGESVDGENLFERAISHAEVGFFPGSQAKRNYLVSLQTQLFNKVFYLSKQNWPAIIQALGSSLEQKHLMVYMEDPKLFSYLASQNWAGVMPRGTAAIDGETSDFLAINEANLGANKSNYYVKRSLSLDTILDKDGGVKHTLRVSYNNTSPTDVFPGGTYKNYFRIYLPLGTKINKATIGESDITSLLAPFSDYGRSGYSTFFEVLPQETKNLTLEYTLGNKLGFKNSQVKYRLDILKQAGVNADPLNWTLSYPINYEVTDVVGQAINSNQQIKISSDLIEDRSFEFIIKQK